MQNPNNPNDNTDYPDDPSSGEGGPGGGTPTIFVGYDPNGNPIYANNAGQQFTFSSPDGTWQPYSGEASPTQNTNPNTGTPPPPPVLSELPGYPTETPPQAPPPTGSSGPSTGGQTQFPAFNDPWQPPAQTSLPDAPVFQAPGYTPPPAFEYEDYDAATPFSYADYQAPEAFSFANFTAPTAESALNDPGYQFRTQQGQKQLERSAAARGVMNTGMNLKDILDYGQNAASQEYQNVWNRDMGAYGTNRNNAFQNYVTNAETGFNTYKTNRGNALENYNFNEDNRYKTYATNRAGAVDTYNTNYKTQYYDPYQFAYKSAYDTFGGNMDAWKTNAGFTERANQFNSDTAYRAWVQNAQNWYREQENRWGRARDVYTA